MPLSLKLLAEFIGNALSLAVGCDGLAEPHVLTPPPTALRLHIGVQVRSPATRKQTLATDSNGS